MAARRNRKEHRGQTVLTDTGLFIVRAPFMGDFSLEFFLVFLTSFFTDLKFNLLSCKAAENKSSVLTEEVFRIEEPSSEFD